jgi:hypothetical protein
LKIVKLIVLAIQNRGVFADGTEVEFSGGRWQMVRRKYCGKKAFQKIKDGGWNEKFF